jgi:hypothetical protein
MTEAKWLECTDPQKMLEFLRGKASDRKSRLFAVACCRGHWRLLEGSASREAVEVAERFADGRATSQELRHVATHARSYSDLVSKLAVRALEDARGRNRHFVTRAYSQAAIAEFVEASTRRHPDCYHLCRFGIFFVDGAMESKSQAFIEQARLSVLSVMTDLVHCIFGNPFHLVTIDPSWLTWNDGIVQKVAQAIYEEPAFERMPILADALEEAGCHDPDILNHCRQPGNHVRGCWIVDALLGKS